MFKLWLDLGPAPIANASAAYAVLPGLTLVDAAGALRRLKIISNKLGRQVVAYTQAEAGSTATSKATIMAVVHEAGDVFTKAEMGYDLATNTTLILAITQTDVGINFAFSRPTGGAGTVRLTADLDGLGGFAGGLKTAKNSVAASCSVTGGQQIVDLEVPLELGRTAVGSCVAV